MKQRFEFVFEDEGMSKLTYETSTPVRERMEIAVENGTSVLYLNREGAEVLAKILVKLGLGSYERGFHLHVPKNFDHEQGEALRIVLLGDSRQSG